VNSLIFHTRRGDIPSKERGHTPFGRMSPRECPRRNVPVEECPLRNDSSLRFHLKRGLRELRRRAREVFAGESSRRRPDISETEASDDSGRTDGDLPAKPGPVHLIPVLVLQPSGSPADLLQEDENAAGELKKLRPPRPLERAPELAPGRAPGAGGREIAGAAPAFAVDSGEGNVSAFLYNRSSNPGAIYSKADLYRDLQKENKPDVLQRLMEGKRFPSSKPVFFAF